MNNNSIFDRQFGRSYSIVLVVFAISNKYNGPACFTFLAKRLNGNLYLTDILGSILLGTSYYFGLSSIFPVEKLRN
jgi:hypothetical protein